MCAQGAYRGRILVISPRRTCTRTIGVLRATASVGATDALYAPWSPSHARAAGRRAEGQLAWWGALGSYFDPQLFLWSPPPLRDAHAGRPSLLPPPPRARGATRRPPPLVVVSHRFDGGARDAAGAGWRVAPKPFLSLPVLRAWR